MPPSSPPRESAARQDERSWRLRGLLWRMQLGVLPSHFDSVDALRRAAADGRRRYADLRRKHLVDPHLMEEGQKPPDVGMDNPLSLDPDSVWGKYFRNAEIERVIDKDLFRLYPEHGDFFQSSGCQAMLRRILLVWSLMHPQLSYRQGMHELLAPLLYALHVDVVHLSQIKKKYEDLFDDRFDDDVGALKTSKLELPLDFFDNDGGQKLNGHREGQDLNVDLKVLVMGSDMYGAEGELGALFSPRFMEHDAYCMFDVLLSGRGGAVRMSEYFASTGVPDASAALYRTLAAADITLYTHLVELGVQPQYFALRWLRLLFGREFVLEDLLLVWDAIFSASNDILPQEGEDASGGNISQRSALISAIAVSILLHSRAALLAALDATGCLQRLLSSPHLRDVRGFLENARILQPLAESAARSPPPSVAKHSRSPSTAQKSGGATSKGGVLRHQKSAPSPELLKLFLAEGYWEEKWRTSVLERKASIDSVTVAKAESKGKGAAAKGKRRNTTTTTAAAASEPLEADAPSEVVSKECAPEEATSLKNSNTEAETSSTPTRNEGWTSEQQPLQNAERQKDDEEESVPKPSSRASKTTSVPDEKYAASTSRSSQSQNKLKGVKTREEVVSIDDPLGLVTTSASTPQQKPAAAVVNNHQQQKTAAAVVNNHQQQKTAAAVVNNHQQQKTTAAVTSNHQQKPAAPVANHHQQSTSAADQVATSGGAARKLDDILKSPCNYKTPVAAQSLGQAMVEQIQVLEMALSQKARDGEQIVLAAKGRVAAMVALAELRKISNALLQM